MRSAIVRNALYIAAIGIVLLALPVFLHAGVLDAEYTAPKSSPSTFTSSSLFDPTPISNQTFQLSGGTTPTSQQSYSTTPTRSQPTSLSGGSYGGSQTSVSTIPISGSSLVGNGGSDWIGGAPSLSSDSFSGGDSGLYSGGVQILNTQPIVQETCPTVSWGDSGDGVSCSAQGGSSCRATQTTCTQPQIDEMHQRILSGKEVVYTDATGKIYDDGSIPATAPPATAGSFFWGLFDAFSGLVPNFGAQPGTGIAVVDPWASTLFSPTPFSNVVPSSFSIPVVSEIGKLGSGFFERTKTVPADLSGGSVLPEAERRTVQIQPYSGFFTTRPVEGSLQPYSYLDPDAFLSGSEVVARAQIFAESALEYSTLFGGPKAGADIANLLTAQAAFENSRFNEACNASFKSACGVGQYIPSTWNAQASAAFEAANELLKSGNASEKQAAQALFNRVAALQKQGTDLRADPDVVAAVMAYHKASRYDEFVEVADRLGVSVNAVAQMEHFGRDYYTDLKNNPNGTGQVSSVFIRQNDISCNGSCTPLKVAQDLDRRYQGTSSVRPLSVADNLLGATDRFIGGSSSIGNNPVFVTARNTAVDAINSAFGGNGGALGNPVGDLLQSFMPMQQGQGQETVNPFGILDTVGNILGPALSGQPINDELLKQQMFGQTIELINGIGDLSGNGQVIRGVTGVISAVAQQGAPRGAVVLSVDEMVEEAVRVVDGSYLVPRIKVTNDNIMDLDPSDPDQFIKVEIPTGMTEEKAKESLREAIADATSRTALPNTTDPSQGYNSDVVSGSRSGVSVPTRSQVVSYRTPRSIGEAVDFARQVVSQYVPLVRELDIQPQDAAAKAEEVKAYLKETGLDDSRLNAEILADIALQVSRGEPVLQFTDPRGNAVILSREHSTLSGAPTKAIELTYETGGLLPALVVAEKASRLKEANVPHVVRENEIIILEEPKGFTPEEAQFFDISEQYGLDRTNPNEAAGILLMVEGIKKMTEKEREGRTIQEQYKFVFENMQKAGEGGNVVNRIIADLATGKDTVSASGGAIFGARLQGIIIPDGPGGLTKYIRSTMKVGDKALGYEEIAKELQEKADEVVERGEGREVCFGCLTGEEQATYLKLTDTQYQKLKSIEKNGVTTNAASFEETYGPYGYLFHEDPKEKSLLELVTGWGSEWLNDTIQRNVPGDIVVNPITGNMDPGATAEYGFARGRLHGSVDTYAPDPNNLSGPDVPVFAAADGVVTMVREQVRKDSQGRSQGYGWLIDIAVTVDGNPYTFRYSHVAPEDSEGNPIAVGQRVKAGEAISYVTGSGTFFGDVVDRFGGDHAAAEAYLNENGWGNITKPHLDFSVRTTANTYQKATTGNTVNPITLFPELRPGNSFVGGAIADSRRVSGESNVQANLYNLLVGLRSQIDAAAPTQPQVTGAPSPSGNTGNNGQQNQQGQGGQGGLTTGGSGGTSGQGSGTDSSGGLDIGNFFGGLTGNSGGGGQQNPAQQILCAIGGLGGLAGSGAGSGNMFSSLLGGIFGGIMNGLTGGACNQNAVSNTSGFSAGASVQGGTTGSSSGGLVNGVLNTFFSAFGQLMNQNSSQQPSQSNVSQPSLNGSSTQQAVVTLIPSPIAVETGAKARLTWASSGVERCKVFDPDGVNIVTGGASGSFETLPLARSVVFRIACRTEGGAIETTAATVIVFGYNGTLADTPLPSSIQF